MNTSTVLPIPASHDHINARWVYAKSTGSWHRVGGAPRTGHVWLSYGSIYTHYSPDSESPTVAPRPNTPAPILTDSDACAAMTVQQDAQSRFTFRGGWDGHVVFTAAELGILKGRELERNESAEREKRSQELIMHLRARTINLERQLADASSTELAALRLERDGLRTRLELVRRALTNAI